MTTTLPTKFTPKKSLGQNFLINPHIIDRIIDAARISEKDLVLEIGPGTGNLTEKLAKKAGQVIAIEKDNRLIEPLREKFKNFKNIEIIQATEFRPEALKLISLLLNVRKFNYALRGSGR